MPGPGTYDSVTLPSASSQGKSIAKRYSEAKTSNQFTPGPGAYPISDYIYPKAPNAKIGKSSRDVEENFRKKFANYPSPDRYNPQSKFKAASFSFGTGQRHSLSQTNLITPAPNAYSLLNKGVDKGPAYHMGLKLDN